MVWWQEQRQDSVRFEALERLDLVDANALQNLVYNYALEALGGLVGNSPGVVSVPDITSGEVPDLLAPRGLQASLRRIGALVRRYIYLLRSSGIRLVELIYWPFLQMLTWGFLQKYLAGTDNPYAQAAG